MSNGDFSVNPTPGTQPTAAIRYEPNDPAELEATFKVLESQEYKGLQQALQATGLIRHQGKIYTLANLDKFVEALVHDVAKYPGPIEVRSRADYIADEVKRAIKVLTEKLKSGHDYEIR